MPVQLDIAGNFAAGQKATLDRRRARQFEALNDIDIGRERRNDDRSRARFEAGRDSLGLRDYDWQEDYQTNQEPLIKKFINLFRQKKNDVKPTLNAAQANEQGFNAQAGGGNIWDQAASREQTAIPTGNQWDDANALEGQYQDGGRVGVAGLRTPPTTPGNYNFGNGGRVALPQRRAYADGGRTRRPMTREEHEEAALWRNTPIVQRLSRPGPPTNEAPKEGGFFGGLGRAIRGVRESTKATRVDERVMAAESEAAGYNITGRRKESFRAGLEGRAINPIEEKTAGDILLGSPIESTAQPYSGDDRQSAIPPADQEVRPLEDEVITPDERVAQSAIAQGRGLVAQSEEINRLPGAIDMSKVNFQSSDIPSISIEEWDDYRREMIRAELIGGGSASDAMAEVTRTQQQGFVDYLTQAQSHMGVGNLQAAASAIVAAYQYFPNGSDMKIGVATSPKTGERVLVATGRSQETGELVGQPQLINLERLGLMITNFSDPKTWQVWAKDGRAEDLEEREFDETLREGESMRTLREDQGAYYRDTGAGNKARGEAAGNPVQDETVEEAQARFNEDLDMKMIGKESPIGRYLRSVMTQVKQAGPHVMSSVISEMIMDVYENDPEQLPFMLQRMGIRVGPPPSE